MSGANLLDVIQAEYKCELTGLPLPEGIPPPEINVELERVYQIKEAYIAEDPEADEFTSMYLECLRICRQELERMDIMTDEFCSSYLEALKPGPVWTDDSKAMNMAMQHINANGKRGGEEAASMGLPVQGGYNTPHKKRRGNLPKASTNHLKKWLFDHLFHPYPTEEEKSALSMQTGMSLNQINNWFINARRRILNPMRESVRQSQQLQGIESPLPVTPPKPQKKGKSRMHSLQDDEY